MLKKFITYVIGTAFVFILGSTYNNDSSKIDELMNEVDSLKFQIAKLEKTNSNLEYKNLDLENIIASTDMSYLEQMENIIDEIKKENNDLKIQIKELEKEIFILNSNLTKVSYNDVNGDSSVNSNVDSSISINTNVYYAKCADARAAGAAPIYEGEPGYRAALDRDGDGIACE